MPIIELKEEEEMEPDRTKALLDVERLQKALEGAQEEVQSQWQKTHTCTGAIKRLPACCPMNFIIEACLMAYAQNRGQIGWALNG